MKTNNSIYDKQLKIMEEYNTLNNTSNDFPIGTKVKVICLCQDFNFFDGETGTVIDNTNSYLGIRVEFDTPRYFKDGTIQKNFGFNPTDLLVLDNNDINLSEPKNVCPHCGGKL